MRQAQIYPDICVGEVKVRLDRNIEVPRLDARYGSGGMAEFYLRWPATTEDRPPANKAEFGLDHLSNVTCQRLGVRRCVVARQMPFPAQLRVRGFGGCESLLTAEGAKDWGDCTISPSGESLAGWREVARLAGVSS